MGTRYHAGVTGKVRVVGSDVREGGGIEGVSKEANRDSPAF